MGGNAAKSQGNVIENGYPAYVDLVYNYCINLLTRMPDGRALVDEWSAGWLVVSMAGVGLVMGVRRRHVEDC